MSLKNPIQYLNLSQKTLLPIILFSITIPLGFTSGYLVEKQLLKSASNLADNSEYEKAIQHAKQATNLTQTATTFQEWQQISQHWQQALTALKLIPTSAANYQLIQTKISEYQINLNYALENAKQPPYFRNAVNYAMSAAKLTQNANTASEWAIVVKQWQQAIKQLQAIPKDAANYQTAQAKLKEYQRNIEYASQKIEPSSLAVQEPIIKGSPQWEQALAIGKKAANLAQNATFQSEWQTVANNWQKAINLLQNLDRTDANYHQAQAKIITYQSNYNYALNNAQDPPYFRNAINHGMQAAILSQTAKSKQQWDQVVKYWQKAILGLQSLSQNSPNYELAQTKISEYQNKLKYALENYNLATSSMSLIKTILGQITPKSVVHSGTGLFFAQNMMYSHSITVYNRNFDLVKTLKDTVNLREYGYKIGEGLYQGAPVESAFSHNGKYAWISNYQMYGKGFNNPGNDGCSPESNHDLSFLYRINTESLAIEKVIQVGAVPKYVATTPNNKLVLVSNWCTWDLSVIDTQKNQEIKKVSLGRYPRGIVVEPNSKIAYIAIMGDTKIAKIDLNNFSVNWLKDVGLAPRHLVIDPEGKYLYASLNFEGKIAKIDLQTEKVITKVYTGSAPRSMAISGDGNYIYVVNYSSNTVSKIHSKDLKIIETVTVNNNPIGITYDSETKQVWVACYSGSIMVFQD